MPIKLNEILNAGAFRQTFENLGELKFWPITAGNFSELQKILVKPESLTPRSLVLELILLVGTRINSENEKERGARIDRGELDNITDNDLNAFSQSYVLRHPELIFKDRIKARGLNESERLQRADLRKTKAETFTQYLARALEDYHKREMGRLAETLSGFSAAYRDLFTANQQLSNKIGLDLDKFIHEPIPPAALRNPRLSKLDDIAGTMATLVRLNQESVRLVASLNDLQRQASLEFATSARQSDRNAKIATTIAVTSLIVSLLFSGISLYENNKVSKQNDILIQTLLEQNNLLKSGR